MRTVRTVSCVRSVRSVRSVTSVTCFKANCDISDCICEMCEAVINVSNYSAGFPSVSIFNVNDLLGT